MSALKFRKDFKGRSSDSGCQNSFFQEEMEVSLREFQEVGWEDFFCSTLGGGGGGRREYLQLVKDPVGVRGRE